jgi:hypothetical protein
VRHVTRDKGLHLRNPLEFQSYDLQNRTMRLERKPQGGITIRQVRKSRKYETQPRPGIWGETRIVSNEKVCICSQKLPGHTKI